MIHASAEGDFAHLIQCEFSVVIWSYAISTIMIERYVGDTNYTLSHIVLHKKRLISMED